MSQEQIKILMADGNDEKAVESLRNGLFKFSFIDFPHSIY